MENKFTDKIVNATKEIFSTDEIFWRNEIHANKRVAMAMLNSGVILLVCWVLVAVGVFNHVSLSAMTSVTIFAEIEFITAFLLAHFTKGKKRWLKAVLIILMITSYSRVDSVLTIYVPLLMALPVVISCRYYSRRLTNFVSVLTILAFTLSAVFGNMLGMGMVDLNNVNLTTDTFISAGGSLRDIVIAAGINNADLTKEILIHSFLPRVLIFSIIAIVCSEISFCGRKMILDADKNAHYSARIQTELGLASRLQIGLLPHIFPAFPDRKEFDVYASMDAAKEVGGDFYDLFFVDDDHLAVVMADVSGKGVPAALFMMASKTIINNFTTLGDKSPGEILELVNDKLCVNNEAEMFVTVWLGILELSTGIFTIANAGHEDPFVRESGGKYEAFKRKHDFVLGGMEGMKYNDVSYQMKPGGSLFIYTDGVTEATNSNKELYGSLRMENALNKNPDAEPGEILKNIKADIDEFVGDEEQFDDITMLCIRYNG